MFSANQLGAGIAFIAFGANFMAMALLLLFNPRSRAIRWFAAFTIVQLLWLALQGLLLMYQSDGGWWRMYGTVVHMLPAFFFAAMLVQRAPTRQWQPYAPLAAGLITLLLIPDPLLSRFGILWHAVMWGTPALLYARQPWQGHHSPGSRRLGLMLGGIVPVAVVCAILLEGGFILFVLPVMTIGIQLMLFYGIVYHRYYDIEVRAARSGELAAAAAEQDRLALLGELSATIAHEVRNPLTGIRSLTQMLAESPLDDERRRRYTGVILDEITRLDRIVGNLTDLARRSAADVSVTAAPTPLAPLFEDLIMLVEPRARRVNVALDAVAHDVTVHAPRESLAQALLNLLINAVAHSPPHGVVHMSAASADGSVTIVVRDQGVGVPADQRARIFEPFQSSGGTGLGLAVVRRLADEHGWTVDVDASPDGGAAFRIILPVSASSPRAADAPTPDPSTSAPNSIA